MMSDQTTSDMARKVRALLDKAEATEFTFERDAFTAKAMKLMAQHQISEAMIADARPAADRRDTFTERTVGLGKGVYVRARLSLIDAVSRANTCKIATAVRWEGRVVYVAGFAADVERVEVLYTSLLLQATSEMNRMEIPAGAKAVTVRRSFLLGFGTTVGRRLRETLAEETVTYERDTGTTGVALVLADRKHEVEDLFFKRYGKLRSLGQSSASVDSDAVRSGRAAGERADISGGRGVRGSAGRVGAGA